MKKNTVKFSDRKKIVYLQNNKTKIRIKILNNILKEKKSSNIFKHLRIIFYLKFHIYSNYIQVGEQN